MAGQGMQIQGTGHGDLVQAADGSWWMVFLAYRNFGGSYHHIGRETCLAPVEWQQDQWPVVNGGNPIDTLMSVMTLPAVPMRKPASRTLFNNKLGPEWVYIQNPIAENYQMKEGWLRLRANGWLADNKRPTFVGRRQESAVFTAETEVEVPQGNGICGLTVYQINDGFIHFYVSEGGIAVGGKLKSVELDMEKFQWYLDDPVPQTVRLRITSDGRQYQFLYALPGQEFELLDTIDCALLSTEVVGGFTGVTIGMTAEAMDSDADCYGVFSYFDYQEH
jgi:alpha-N-arabinofuranosidase